MNISVAQLLQFVSNKMWFSKRLSMYRMAACVQHAYVCYMINSCSMFFMTCNNLVNSFFWLIKFSITLLVCYHMIQLMQSVDDSGAWNLWPECDCGLCAHGLVAWKNAFVDDEAGFITLEVDYMDDEK